MKRVQLFEFEDLSWFPDVIRSGMTRVLGAMHRVTKLHETLANECLQVMDKSDENSILDYCSGSGGAMPEVLEEIQKTNSTITLELSDKYPNKESIKRFSKRDGITYHDESIDASKIERKRPGLKTIVNAFHHMPADSARNILRTAQAQGDTILIYEMAENKIPLLLWWLFLPIGLCIVFLMALILTPFAKGVTLSQIFFTYIIPIIPMCYAWDGQASMPRIYSPADIDKLLEEIGSKEGYEWEFRAAKNRKGKKQGTILLGRTI